MKYFLSCIKIKLYLYQVTISKELDSILLTSWCIKNNHSKLGAIEEVPYLWFNQRAKNNENRKIY